MALIQTIVVGGVLWWVSLKTIGTRAALGQGGPLVYLAILLFVALATAHTMRVRGPGSPAPAAGSARSWVSPIVLAVVLVAALGLALSLLGPLPGPGGVWLVGAALLAVAFGLAAFVQALTRAARRAPAPSFPVSPVRTDSSTALLALTPMLVPLVALLALRWLPPGGGLAGRVAPVGLTGILYLAMLTPFLPAALLVAWGLDRLDGSPSGPAGRVVVGLALAALVSCAAVFPVVFPQVFGTGGVPEGTPPWLLAVLPARGVGPLLRGSAIDASGQRVSAVLPVGSLVAAAPAVLLAASGLTAMALRRAGQGLRGLSVGAAVVLLGGTSGLAAALVPHLGPSAAPWSGVAVCALVLLWLKARSARPPG